MKRRVGVALPVPLRRSYDYELTSGQSVVVGSRVRVPFGSRRLLGIVLETDVPAMDGVHYRSVERVLDEAALIPAELLELCRWASDYYLHPIGEVVEAAVPVALRHRQRSGQPAARVAQTRYLRTAAGTSALPTLAPRAARLRGLLEALAEGAQTREALREHGAAALRRALDLGWIAEADNAATLPDARLPALTPAQQSALDALREGVQAGAALLLEGVTGSGKTELYLRLAAEVLAAGRQVLVLAPEIGLTPQLVRAFEGRFGERVCAYHSGLSEAERARSWLAARDGSVDIVVGTRSAVFVPLARPGLVVVDEEHDGSYKQAEGFRYSARDVAVMRAKRLEVPIVLGSATPSLESLANAQSGRYRHVRLPERVGGGAPPAVGLVDLRNVRLDNGVAPQLLDAAERHLAAGDQVLFFVNRRGYAPALLCHTCGWAASCRHCDARLVFHRGGRRLICHHCGSREDVPAECPDCGSAPLQPVGAGTERIEDVLRRRFPGLRVERYDSDRASRAGELEQLLADAHSGAVRVLVGTQMLAKGHDFAGLSFAGILDADHALYGTDFRALERMAQLVTQVAGRVGRAGRPGEVLLQTHQPQHPMLRLLVGRGQAALAEALLAERRMAGLPPAAHLALLRAEARSEGEALQFLQAVRARLPAGSGVDALGPVPAPMARRAGYLRAQLLLRARSRAALHACLRGVLADVEQMDAARRLRWSVDVDPGDLF